MKRLLALFLAFFAVSVYAADAKEPFTPKPAGCVTISATTSSAATALAFPEAKNVIVYSAGAGLTFIEFGTSTVAATVANSYPVASGQKEALGLPTGTTHVATITGSGTATVYVCVGLGL